VSAGQAAWILVRGPEELDEKDSYVLDSLLQTAPEISTAYILAQDFIRIVRHRRVEELDDWLHRAMTAGIQALKSFAVGLQRDYAAVVAALSLPYSNGQVEGQINRLKLIKRTMVRRVTHRSIAPPGSQD
jgi:transposase